MADISSIRDIFSLGTLKLTSPFASGTGAAAIDVTGISLDRANSPLSDGSMPMSMADAVLYTVTLAGGNTFLISWALETSETPTGPWTILAIGPPAPAVPSPIAAATLSGAYTFPLLLSSAKRFIRINWAAQMQGTDAFTGAGSGFWAGRSGLPSPAI
jgi:hypothetical protein